VVHASSTARKVRRPSAASNNDCACTEVDVDDDDDVDDDCVGAGDNDGFSTATPPT
jgi:hypothetical protein